MSRIDWCNQEHSIRAGGPIKPVGIIVHTTDTMPGGYKAMINQQLTSKGAGESYHFIIGRDAGDGVTQLVDLSNNGEHAGGNPHGSFTDVSLLGSLFHPNLYTIGIEIDNAGMLVQSSAGWLHKDSGKYYTGDLYTDNVSQVWAKVTDYQLEQLAKLVDAIRPRLYEMPESWRVKPDGLYIKANRYSAMDNDLTTKRPWIVCHATLDPVNRVDPGPQVWEFIKQRYYK
jgi:N-acetyl-anhydromuramyl-L-alanine amidase AmpD